MTDEDIAIPRPPLGASYRCGAWHRTDVRNHLLGLLMKQSHLSTPRTLGDCDFQTCGAAIERPTTSEAGLGAIALTVLIVIAACAAGAYLIGG